MIRDMERSDWRRVSEIYTQGLANGTATFETVCPSYDDWDRRHLPVCRYVAVEEDNVIRGTAMYWRMTSAMDIFLKMDYFIFSKIRKLLHRLYPKKSHKWIKGKHYRPSSNKECKDKYLFTDQETGQQQIRMQWFKVRYNNYPLKFGVSPYIEPPRPCRGRGFLDSFFTHRFI